MLLVVLEKAKQKYPFRTYGVCLMANHIHLLLKPQDATQLPKLMHWVGWYASMLLNRISKRCGHFWEARYYATPIAPEDHQRALNTLRYIHANPKAAGVRKGFYDPYSNYGHYSRLESDGLSDWHPAFLQLAPTLTGCSKRYQNFCKKYRCKSKPIKIKQWGSKLIALLKGTATRAARIANAIGNVLVSKHCHSTCRCCSNSPSSGKKSPSSFAVAMHHAGMMMIIAIAVRAQNAVLEGK